MSLPTIALIATGGTIAGQAANANEAVRYQPGALDVSALLSAVPGLDALATLQAEQLYAIDSAHITAAHWQQLSCRVQQLLDDDTVDGVVILHGTDTMEETAWYLHLTVSSDKPVVLTGAMRPATALSADGPMNLYHAVSAAAQKASRSRGVLVVFGDAILSARGLQKRDAVPAAFDADRYGRLGMIAGADVFYYQQPARQHGGLMPSSAELPQVGLLYAYADMPAALIFAAAEGVKGLVLAGLGNGNLRPDWLEAVSGLIARGVVVARASRVPNGTVVHNRTYEDDVLGLVSCDNHTPPQARLLLMLGLAKGLTRSGLQSLFDTY
ncbi:asparaginase [Leeia oryzae]|uniref:asparaginase n=1 Tax=Leeia oryzae TaxID=356662 RepID=UPI00037CDADB|nr:asparaginase [Leeia oryzae]